jgi:GTPase SAR1 family protein
MLCFSVDSPDSLENVESKWVGEIAENCPGVKLVLVALKCDLREQEKDDREDGREPKKPTIDYKQGLAVAEKVKALRYLGMLWHLRAARRMIYERRRINNSCRVLSNEEPRRQRSIHRSSSCRSHCQERQRRQRQRLMLCHVSS